MGFFGDGCFKQSFTMLVLFAATLTGLCWIMLWIYNSVSDQYPTGFAAGWFCFFGLCWALTLFRHTREETADRPPIGIIFQIFFGCYFFFCAILMLISFGALLYLDAGGTAIWPFVDALLIVLLLCVFCAKEQRRQEEADDFDMDEDAWCSSPLVNCILVPICIVALFFHISLAAQALGAALDQSSITRPGSLVQTPDVEGAITNMHILCTDNDDDDFDTSDLPVVLLESAINAPGPSSWALVQPLVSRAIRVCSYDRRGYGWSWRGPNPRHVQRFNVELDDLLATAGIAKSLVYVGWGYGGLAATSYAFNYPNQVKGVVYVDALHPRAAAETAAAESATVFSGVEDEFGVDAGPSTYDKVVRFFAPLGFIRMGEQGSVATGSLGYPFDILKLLPTEAFEAYRAFLLGYYHPNVVVQEKREWAAKSADDVLKAVPPKDSSVTCKTKDACDLYSVEESPLTNIPVGVYKKKSDDTDYISWQTKLAELSNNSIVEDSTVDSFLPMRDPDSLARFIVRIVARAAIANGLQLDVQAEGRKRSVRSHKELESLLVARVDKAIRERDQKK